MSRHTIRFALAIVVVVTSIAVTNARELTFDERVRIQEAIERVYYSHQMGATRPFGEAVPREAIEAKVKTYLKQSVAVEKVWNTPVTDWMLERELERMAEGSKLPERLIELFAALGDDTFLIKECLARPALVDRLSRNFFAFDSGIHAATRAAADDLRDRLAAGELSFSSDHPGRSVVHYALRRSELDTPENPRQRDANRVALSLEEFREERGKLPARIGQAGGLDETREAFVTTIVLRESAKEFQVASYAVPKLSWDSWWTAKQRELAWQSLEPIAREGMLPTPASARSMSANRLSCVPDDTWDNGILDSFPDPRYWRHTAVWTGTLMLIWGVRDGDRYDPATDSWSSMSAIGAPAALFEHTAVWSGSAMLVWGGRTTQADLNTGGRYDPANDTWTPISLSGAPVARTNHTAVWTGTSMLVWGGTHDGAYLGTGGKYTPATDMWAPISTTLAPSARTGHSSVWSGSFMVIWGGEGSSGPVDSGGRYDPVTNTWLSMRTGAPSARASHSTIWTGSLMVVWGGSVGNSGGRYDPAANVWTATNTTGAPSARVDHSAAWTGSEMVLWGGEDVQGEVLSTGGRYDPASDSWTPTTTTGAPSARSQHSAIWTGSTVVIWGGFHGTTSLNTGGRYSPATDSWTPTSSQNAPSARDNHTAVWTGTLMVVFGGTGRSFDDRPATGGRYDPAIDAWTPTTTLGALPGRIGHTALWTGSAMVVWGGDDNNFATANWGSRYDPTLDMWSPTSLVGAPEGRQWHTAVWTGTEMVVWGGSNVGGTVLNSGGRYDPVSDSWVPTSLAGAPPSRRFHTAVWAGSSMVVWGGFLSTGGRYDPMTDLWLPTTTVGAPAARGDHTAVWTGTAMIVWGGRTGSVTNVKTGGLYDPATDVWTATATSGAPEARHDHTAVWTRSIMVVWGGVAAEARDTGGRYNPIGNTWEPTSTVGSAAVRRGHRAVWTGSAMIVWGGWNDQGQLDSGGRYFVGAAADDDGDGFSECAGDCDDGNTAINPGAAEACDGADNDCDLIIDNLDSDGDGLSTCSDDNCPDAYNPDQADADGDHIGDPCDLDRDGDGIDNSSDNCPNLSNASQANDDTDPLGNACDNCPSVSNLSQHDLDSDGEGDHCDQDDGLIYQFRFDRNHVDWQAESGFDAWNLYEGDLQVLKSTGEYTQAPGSNSNAARICVVVTSSVTRTDIPLPGTCAFSLVTGMQGGLEGGLGQNSAGAERTNDHPCP